MSEIKHTPGPWIFYADIPSQEPNWHIVTTENKMRVLANVHIEPGNGVDEANARLIAAAPDLLDALKAIVQNKKWDFRSVIRGDVLLAADAAIAKAEGRS